MFNVTVFRMKDIIKYFFGFVITIVFVVIISKYFNKDTNREEKIIKEVKNGMIMLSENSLLGCLDNTLPSIKILNDEYRNISNEDDHKEEKNILQAILNTQISSINGIDEIEEEKETIAEVKQEEEEKNEEENPTTEKVETGVQTQVITNNPIADNSNVQYGKVKIKNQTDYVLTEEMLKPDVTIENKNILLFHTHSCESYTASQKYPYTPTGNFRTTDLNFTVTRVGTELQNQLNQYGYNVIHNTDYHDYPAYNGSYTRSLATVENILKENPTDIIMDVHRDAIGSRSDYAPTVKIGDTDEAAQIMFVIGTNGGGLWHPNWNQNLKFAIKIQEKAEEMYPGLFKSILLTDSRYNQHTGKYASIIEVGATGNTLEQCLTSMKYLAKVMSEVMQ